ncbi:MAG: hypothetical protein HLUCCA11_22400 [Phormidesmis priestleyi Ana]|uniref:Antitoxin n=1 Tax=Phormidesmis priestleyi Ana TaxID=1666911 RepID=A0A0P7YNZ3_9CYAN|nr:MAG: hypothetical protein HLUCCA11_22400 [Phormidesmis priestleyi Ana]
MCDHLASPAKNRTIKIDDLRQFPIDSNKNPIKFLKGATPVTFSLENIRSLTDFRRHTKDYVGKLRESNAPLVLTVNGEAALVVQNAKAFQDGQDRLQQVEVELQTLKLEALKQNIQLGINQLESGEHTTYTEETSATLIEKIKEKGRSQKVNA